MVKKCYSTEQIIAKLREADMDLAKGQRAAEVCRKMAGAVAPTWEAAEHQRPLGAGQPMQPAVLTARFCHGRISPR